MKVESRLSNKICPDGMSVEEWQIALRRETARDGKFTVEHLDDNRIWGDYLVTTGAGRYRTAFRGVCSDRNFCSCLDFRTNGLGTCKHLEAVSLYLEEHVPGYPWAGTTYTPPYTSIYVSYKGGRSIRMRIGSDFTQEYLALYQRYFTAEGELPESNYHLIQRIAEEGTAISASFRMYEDVLSYAQERCDYLLWQEELKQTFPSERIPWDRVQPSDQHFALETLLYRLCHQAHGLIVGGKDPIFIHLAARLAEEIYQGIELPAPGYILVDTASEVVQWQTILSRYEEFATLPIHLTTCAEFVEQQHSEQTTVSFVWVDNASGLKDWQNAVSIALKKLTIEHLYMRIESLHRLSPVQLSSTLQHISPFVIGPFYKFIHLYRPIFPLRDDGSNMPPATAALIFLCGDLPKRVQLDSPKVEPTRATAPIQPKHAEVKVQRLLSALIDVVEDANALALLKQKLHP